MKALTFPRQFLTAVATSFGSNSAFSLYIPIAKEDPGPGVITCLSTPVPTSFTPTNAPRVTEYWSYPCMSKSIPLFSQYCSGFDFCMLH